MKEKLDAYRGKLSVAQIAAGMNAAAKNASRLAEDAETLLKAGRFPTAASIAVLAIEEAGKVSILRGLTLTRTDVELTKAWKDYRSHTKKNILWLLPQLVLSGARKLDDFHLLFDKAADHPFVLDQIKQLGFYTDCLGNAHWSMPDDIINEQLANMLVKISKIFAKDSEYTEREIELWIEHLGPVWKKDPSWMKQALVNWYAAMQEAGLAPEGPNKMKQFIRNGL